MLMWNLKNVEYALGANVSDLSMRFWDIDERHAFEGDHVILRQGYSGIVEHMIKGLVKKGDRFEYKLNFPAGQLEYSRRTTTQPIDDETRSRRLIELSDTCRVTSQDGEHAIDCDFVVSCLPLGVLKEATREESRDGSVLFDPALPFSKRDAIESVGFGLLNKVYLQFPLPFWRHECILGQDQTLFGNASGTNPHHYMFFDIGKGLGSPTDSPAILMSLISGREAVKCECLTDNELIAETVTTLRLLFPDIGVPDPIAFKITRWGKDRFSRGSYTFLPPGTTDQDFQLLQSPINGNGDSLLLEGSETMRVFFGGEHTTALHPSMAHGALLSGVRAAKEVHSAMCLPINEDEAFDRLIPLALYRHMNPKAPLVCNFCHRTGTTIREGSLLSFKKGSRQVLVHNSCAENSPEVEVYEGKWKDVFKAVNRSRSIPCFLCSQDGASIGCTHEDCYRCYHFSCGEDTGWRFENDGKEFYCDSHRVSTSGDCVRISLDFYRSRHRYSGAMTCQLCGVSGEEKKCGSLLAFQKHDKVAVVHENCARYTSVVDIGEDSHCRLEHEYRNIFEAISVGSGKSCHGCQNVGATINCSEPSCSLCFHFACAEEANWDFSKRAIFRCSKHRTKTQSKSQSIPPPAKSAESSMGSGVFHHTLFSLGTSLPDQNRDTPGKLDMSNAQLLSEMATDSVFVDSSSESEEDPEPPEHQETESFQDQNLQPQEFASSSALTSDYESFGMPLQTHLARLYRSTLEDLWNVDFYVTPVGGNRTTKQQHSFLSVAMARPDPYDELRDGDIVTAINGTKVGSPDLDSLEKVLSRLSKEVDAMVEVQRAYQ
jgi:hypothetical protein